MAVRAPLVIRRMMGPVAACRRSRCWLGLGALCCAGSVGAAQYDLQLSANAVETYTDNVAAAGKGNEQAEFVTTLNPGFRVEGKGRHLNLAVDYRLQDIRYARGTSADSRFHQLDANAEIKALHDQFNFVARVTQSQQIVDEQGTVTTTNITATNNRTNVGTLSLTPDLSLRLGDYAVFNASLAYNDVSYQSATANGGATQALSLQLASGTHFNKLGWSLSANSSRDTAANSIKRAMNGQLSYRVGPKTRLFGNLGYENNSYPSAAATSGTSWEIGGSWQADRRTELTFSLGDRYYSRTYTLNFNHAMRRSNVSVTYNQSLETTSSLQLGQPVFDASGTVLLGFGVPVQQNDVFITKTWNGAYSLESRRTKLNLGFTRQTRQSSLTLVDDEINSLNGSLSVTLPHSTALSLSGTVRRSSFGASSRADDFTSLTLGATRKLPSDLSLGASLRRQAQSSNNSAAEFAENAITFTLGFTM